MPLINLFFLVAVANGYFLSNFRDEYQKQVQYSIRPYRTFINYYETPDVKAYDMAWSAKLFKSPTCHSQYVLKLLSDKTFRDEYYLCVKTEGDKRVFETYQLKFELGPPYFVKVKLDGVTYDVSLVMAASDYYIFYGEEGKTYMTTKQCLTPYYTISNDKIIPPSPSYSSHDNFIKYYFVYSCRPVLLEADYLSYYPIRVSWTILGNTTTELYARMASELFKDPVENKKDNFNSYLTPKLNISGYLASDYTNVTYIDHVDDFEIIYFEHVTSNLFVDLIEYIFDKFIQFVINILSTIFEFVFKEIKKYIIDELPSFYAYLVQEFIGASLYFKIILIFFLLIYIRTTKFLKTVFIIMIIIFFSYKIK